MQQVTQVPVYDMRQHPDLIEAMRKLYQEASAGFWAIRYEIKMGMLIDEHEWRDVKAAMSTAHQFLRKHGRVSSYRLKRIAKKARGQ